MESNIRSDLRAVIAKYGLSAVHKELHLEMRETFEFLRSIYEPPKNNLVIPVAEVIPDRIVSPKLGSIIPPLGLTQLPQLELSGGLHNSGMDDSENDDASVVHFPTPVHDPNVKEIHIVSKKETDEFAATPTELGEKFTKQKHKEEVAKKRKELESKGIKPESLLTKENLEKWLAEGLSYMRIAREKVGIHENEVSTIAKTLGLQSNVRKYIVMKKGKS